MRHTCAQQKQHGGCNEIGGKINKEATALQRKASSAARDATKIYLLDVFQQCRELQGKLELKTDKELVTWFSDSFEFQSQSHSIQEENLTR